MIHIRTSIGVRLVIAGSIALGLLAPQSAHAQPSPTGRYIVVFKPTVGPLSAQSVKAAAAQAYNANVIYDYSAALNGFAAEMTEQSADALRADPTIELVEPDAVMRIGEYPQIAPMAPTVIQPNAGWGLDRIDQRDLPLLGKYSYTETGSGVGVYVLDTGIRATHFEFGGRVQSGYTAINDGGGTGDCNGHGSHVAGTAGGAIHGVAKGATLVPVRVLGCDGQGLLSGVIAGVDWVTANHVKPAVANMSLGGSPSAALDLAVQNSIAAGVTYVVAAGNSYGRSACGESPARVANAITVGSTTPSDQRSTFSNIGTCVDLFAPGSDILSAWYQSDADLMLLNGTSMAAPHVAGVVARILQNSPTSTPAAARTTLINWSTPNKIRNAGTGSPNRLLYVPGDAPEPDRDGGHVAYGLPASGFINPAGDVDTFTFDGLGGHNVTIFQQKPGGSSLDSFVELRSSDNRLIGSNDDGGGNNDALLRVTLPRNERYIVNAKGYRSSVGAYNLFIYLTDNPDTDDYRWIAFGQSLSGTINLASDRDTHYVSVAKGRQLRVRMNKVVTTTTSFDPYLELYSPAGARVGYNDDGGGNPNALISYKAPTTGVYRIVARSYYGRTSGPYALVIEDTPLLNLAQGKPAVASSTESVGAEPWLATDTDAATRWSALNADGQWWYVDLGTVQEFDQVVVNWDSGFARDYGIYVSNGVSATTSETISSTINTPISNTISNTVSGGWRSAFWTNEGDGGVDVISFEPQTARYVMVYGARRGMSLPLSLYGVGVFDTAGDTNTLTGTLQIAGAEADPIKPPDEAPPAAPEPPVEGDKDPQLVGEGESAQENAPAASASLPVSPTAPITVELPVAVILQADTKAVETAITDTLLLVGEASANSARGRKVIAYEWSSHRDGVLSTNITATVPISRLAAGPHVLTFRAQDDAGHWSHGARTVWIKAPAAFVFVPTALR